MSKSIIENFINNIKDIPNEYRRLTAPTKYRDESEYASNYKRKNIDDKMIIDFMRSLVNGKKQEYENDDVLLQDFMERLKHDSKHGYDEDEDEVLANSRPRGVQKDLGRKRNEVDIIADIMGDPVKRQRSGGNKTIARKLFGKKPTPAEDFDVDYGMSFVEPTKSPRRTLKLKSRSSR